MKRRKKPLDIRHGKILRYYLLFYFILFCAVVLWCVGFLLPALINQETGAGKLASRGLMLFFSPVCHQMPSRCFHVHGFPLAVCGRCAGIYWGFLSGVLAGAFRFKHAVTPPFKTLIWAAVPMAMEALFDKTGMMQSSNLLRCITGLAFGLTFSFFIPPLLHEWAVLAAKERKYGK